jgi:hypothetical protein
LLLRKAAQRVNRNLSASGLVNAPVLVEMPKYQSCGKGDLMTWILVLVIAGAPTSIVGFENDWACKSAGTRLVKDIGESANYWCFRSS